MSIRGLDAHEVAPGLVRQCFKHYQKLSREAIDCDEDILDFRRGLSYSQQQLITQSSEIPVLDVARACLFLARRDDSISETCSAACIYEVKSMPGMMSEQL